MDKLELQSQNFAKGQKEFRQKYRENVKGWYNGFIHLLMIFLYWRSCNILFFNTYKKYFMVGMVNNSNYLNFCKFI